MIKFSPEQIARMSPERIAELNAIIAEHNECVRKIRALKARKKAMQARTEKIYVSHGVPSTSLTNKAATSNRELLGVIDDLEDDEDEPVDPNAEPDSAFLKYLERRSDEIEADERERRRLHNAGNGGHLAPWAAAMRLVGRSIARGHVRPSDLFPTDLNLFQ